MRYFILQFHPNARIYYFKITGPTWKVKNLIFSKKEKIEFEF